MLNARSVYALWWFVLGSERTDIVQRRAQTPVHALRLTLTVDCKGMRAPIRNRFGARSLYTVVGGFHCVCLQLVRSVAVALTNVAVAAYDGLIRPVCFRNFNSLHEILIHIAV